MRTCTSGFTNSTQPNSWVLISPAPGAWVRAYIGCRSMTVGFVCQGCGVAVLKERKKSLMAFRTCPAIEIATFAPDPIPFHLIYPKRTRSCAIRFDPTPCHPTPCHPHLTPSHPIPSHPTPSHPTPSHPIPLHPI